MFDRKSYPVKPSVRSKVVFLGNIDADAIKPYDRQEKRAFGIERYTVELDRDNLQVWNVPEGCHNSALLTTCRGAKAYVIAFQSGNNSSIENWLEKIAPNFKDAFFILVPTQVNSDFSLTDEYIKHLSAEYNQRIVYYGRTKPGKNIDINNLFKFINATIHSIFLSYDKRSDEYLLSEKIKKEIHNYFQLISKEQTSIQADESKIKHLQNKINILNLARLYLKDKIDLFTLSQAEKKTTYQGWDQGVLAKNLVENVKRIKDARMIDQQLFNMR